MAVVIALVATTGATTPTSAAGTPGRLVVQFAEAVTPDRSGTVMAWYGLTPRDRLGTTGFVLASTTDLARAQGITEDPAVLDARPPVPVHLFATPNDPLFELQWHLRQIQAPRAWEVSTGQGAVVAVLDTGVDRSLPDLADTAFTAPFDFVEGDTDPQDPNGHGTHVAGTIAQTTDNGVGVAGVAYDATLMPVRVLDGAGAGEDWQIAEGLLWAADNGADVANLSLGATRSSLVLEEAVAYATGRGVTVVAAAGNAGIDQVAYPAAYPQVIGVGAVRHDRALAHYSNHGDDLDLVAPGGDTSVDQNGDGYGDGILQQTVTTASDATASACFCFYQGTSMATPHVAGAAALLVAAGASSPDLVRAALIESAIDLGPAGHDPTYGHGLVQARDALDLAPTLSPDGEPTLQPPSSDPADTVPDTSGEQPLPGETRDLAEVCPADEVPPSGFEDVTDDNPHTLPVDCLVWRDIVTGRSADLYAPARAVTREQMATFLARTVATVGGRLPTSPPDVFADDDDSVHEVRINQLAATGIVTGTTDGRFLPGAAVSRAQMATFLVRTAEYVTGTPVNPQLDYFDDDEGSVHEDRINGVARIAVASGVGTRTYGPEHDVRRDQLASFVARLLDYLDEQGHPPDG